MYAMLCNIRSINYIKWRIEMAKGNSGRVVIEIDPDFKRSLYSVLAADGVTLKHWFIQAAEKHVTERNGFVSDDDGVAASKTVKK